MSEDPLTKTFPVAEIFGPTIQGEGVDQGKSCHFVRFGGCDYKCGWCDTPHAVLPERVKALKRMRAGDIVEDLQRLNADQVNRGGSYIRPPWVIVTGGNPAMHNLDHFTNRLHGAGYKVAIETQGSMWKDWLRKVDRLCVSPKPPSSGMLTDAHHEQTQRFLLFALTSRYNEEKPRDWMFLKVVVFNDEDLDYAEQMHEEYPGVPFYLSAGNDAGKTVGHPDREDERVYGEVALGLLDKSQWLVQEVLQRPALTNVIVQSQYHVLLWGNVQGV